jgi:hypothetical protein
LAYWCGKLYLFGGVTDSGTMCESVDYLDLEQPGATWLVDSKLPIDIGRKGMSVISLPDGMYLLGGIT